MIEKRQTRARRKHERTPRLRKNEPLNVDLTVSFRFGDQPDDTVTPIRNRSVPMVDSVFKSRDRIIRGFLGLLIKTGLSTPRVASQVLPFARGPGKRTKRNP